MEGPKGPVKNQFRIIDGHIEYFQSYSTVIAKKNFATGEVTLDPNWNCSKTTSKYRSIFLGESSKETQKKIASGEYKMMDLNC
jgi:hypothetical protein